MKEHTHHTEEHVPNYASAQRHSAEMHGSTHTAHTANDHAAMQPGAHTDHAAHAGHGGHAGHSEAMFQRPFWISLALTIPILIYADLFQELLGYTAPSFPGSAYLPLVLGSIVYWYGGWVFLRGAVDEQRARTPGMMTLVALAITTAYAYSVAITLGIVAGM